MSAMRPSQVTLEQVLAARDARAARQQAMRATHNLPLVSLTLVSPGPVKNGLLQRRVMQEALNQLEDCLRAEGWPILEHAVLWLPTGPEALYAVKVDALELKAALVELESRHPLGRLWDLDVIGAQGSLSRRALGMAPRTCLVCDEAAHACARAQRHSLDSLMAAIEERVNAFDRQSLAA